MGRVLDQPAQRQIGQGALRREPFGHIGGGDPGESFAFISLLFPGTTVLIAAGTLLAAGTLPYASILVGAVLGAVLGDSVSYWLGRSFGGGIAGLWPFSRHPDLLSRGILFFERHGGKSVFIGRF